MAGHSDVTIGLAGDLISRDACTSATVAKAGGRPYFSGIQAPCQASALSCSRCKGLLCLVIQVQLPSVTHGTEDTTQTIYVFCCTNESCASHTDSWRAFSHAVPIQGCNDHTTHNHSSRRAASGPQTDSTIATGTSTGPAAAGTDAWGIASDDWGVSAHEPAEADAAELHTALQQLSVQSALHQQGQLRRPKTARDRQRAEHSPEVQCCSIDGLPCLPAFELWLQTEPGKAEARLNASDDVQHAISAYEQSSTSEGPQPGSSKQPGGSWAHEQYEEDAAFSKYTKRLQRCPGQCLRLSTSGSVLWPRKELPLAPRCPRCQAEKRCMLQLMAPLIAMLHEAADWMAEAGEDYIQEEQVGVPLSWEWLTMLVFACTQQCASSRASAFQEEVVVVVNETMKDGGWAY